MWHEQQPYRDLYNALYEHGAPSYWDAVISPWLAANSAECAWLRDFGQRTGAPIPPADEVDLGRLYALQRVVEILLLGFQSGEADGSSWSGPDLTLSQFEAFAEALGMTVSRPTAFTPFHHEVVALVSDADPSAAPRVLGFLWPCLRLGPLLFQRAGVRVAAGSTHLMPGIADVSTLYWTYRRKYRPTTDLSAGWGSNSQWRTHFRRDYLLDGHCWFNVDGRKDLATTPADHVNSYGLTVTERRELVEHRCFVTTTKRSDDLFPYEDRWRIPAPGNDA